MTETSTLTFSVPDISCQHCVNAISKQVQPLAGVTDLAIDLDAKTVTVTGGAKDAIVAAIDEAGYDVV